MKNFVYLEIRGCRALETILQVWVSRGTGESAFKIVNVNHSVSYFQG